jgi:transcriptional regulator with XRE-family HTH domain
VKASDDRRQSDAGDDAVMDDVRLGAAFRAVRRRHGWRQQDVARRAGVSQPTVSRIERGLAWSMALRELRAVASALEIRLELAASWRGGELPRIVNERHNALGESLMRRFATDPAWIATPEVSFSYWGERGIIDILAWHAQTRSLLVVEIKSELVDHRSWSG